MSQWREEDVRIRPRRGNSRPRSKDRPSHSAAAQGRVVAVDRGRFTAILAGTEAPVFAVKARELGRRAVVVGDEVRLTGDLRGGPDRLARIVRIESRTTTLRRSADDDDPEERVIVANADQLAIVASLASPDPSPGLIDRCLVAAYDAGLEPLLVLTKADSAPAEPLLELYAPLDVRAVVWTQGSPVAEVRAHLAGRLTCLVGHSGVGKSTLVNALVPGIERATGAVNVVTGRGRHTSTQAVAIPLPAPAGTSEEAEADPIPARGWLIDTPGLRSFGLALVDPDRVLHAFSEFDAAIADCPRGCPHTQGAIDCALDGFAAGGGAGPSGPARLASLRRLLATRPAQP